MLTLYDFNQLEPDQQAQHVWQSGEYLMSRHQVDGIAINLYWLSRFFVEVYYDNQAEQILTLRSFVSQHPLEPFLRYISINSLLSA